MASHSLLRVVVETKVADAARNKAETEGKTLADAVVDLLAAYAKGKPKTRRKGT